jgi:microcin C transport system substrate-binding protein
MDEPTTVWAADIAVAPDKLSVTFTINPLARFHDGTPVMAADVKHSFDTLISKEAAPRYAWRSATFRKPWWSAPRRCASG